MTFLRLLQASYKFRAVVAMHAILIVLDYLASEQKFHRNYRPISELYT